MGVPGWPDLAASTASIESVRMVLMANCSKLGLFMGFLLDSFCFRRFPRWRLFAGAANGVAPG